MLKYILVTIVLLLTCLGFWYCGDDEITERSEGRFEFFVEGSEWFEVVNTDNWVRLDTNLFGDTFYHLHLHDYRAAVNYDFAKLEEGETERFAWAQVEVNEPSEDIECGTGIYYMSDNYNVVIQGVGSSIQGTGSGSCSKDNCIKVFQFIFDVPFEK